MSPSLIVPADATREQVASAMLEAVASEFTKESSRAATDPRWKFQVAEVQAANPAAPVVVAAKWSFNREGGR